MYNSGAKRLNGLTNFNASRTDIFSATISLQCSYSRSKEVPFTEQDLLREKLGLRLPVGLPPPPIFCHLRLAAAPSLRLAAAPCSAALEGCCCPVSAAGYYPFFSESTTNRLANFGTQCRWTYWDSTTTHVTPLECVISRVLADGWVGMLGETCGRIP